MQVYDHISDGHLCSDTAFIRPKLIISQYTNIFFPEFNTSLRNDLDSSASVFGSALLTFTSPILLSSKVFIKYLHLLELTKAWKLSAYFVQLIQRQSVEFKRQLLGFCFPDADYLRPIFL